MQPDAFSTRIEQYLSESGVRLTRGRRTIIAALTVAEGPQSVSELYACLEGLVPISSLYRSLALFEEAGVLAPHHGVDGVKRFELAEWLVGHHHHLVCMDCGTVDDIHPSPDIETALKRLVETVTTEVSFRTAGHSLEIDGRCPRCS